MIHGLLYLCLIFRGTHCFCFVLSSQGYLYSKKPWKSKIYLLEQRIHLFTVTIIKTMSFSGVKFRQVHRPAQYKIFRLPRLKSPLLWLISGCLQVLFFIALWELGLREVAQVLAFWLQVFLWEINSLVSDPSHVLCQNPWNCVMLNC